MNRITQHLLPFAFLVGCADTDADDSASAPTGVVVNDRVASETPTQPDSAQPPDDPSPGAPRKLADPPADGATVQLHLYVSNQSFDVSPVSIDVWLGDTHVVTGGFAVEGQHNWTNFDFDIPADTYVLRAESLDGGVILEESISIPAERWGVLDFWYYQDDPGHPRFTWTLHDAPVAFE